MGTKHTIQYKFGLTTDIIRELAEKKRDIFKEELISILMCELQCERRKAMELIKAIIIQFPYKEGIIDERKGYIFKNG